MNETYFQKLRHELRQYLNECEPKLMKDRIGNFLLGTVLGGTLTYLFVRVTMSFGVK